MGRLQGITVDIDGASTRTNFEVIEIMDESSPYPALLRIDWATNMNGVINLKQRKVIFEKKSLRVVVPLDPIDGPRYIELVHNEDKDNALDCVHKIAANRLKEEWRLSRGYASSCTNDSDEEDERWKSRVNGVTTLHCNMMTKSLYFVKAQNHELQMYDGLTVVDEFLVKFKSVVPGYQQFDVLKWTLHVTLTRWWDTHEGTFKNW